MIRLKWRTCAAASRVVLKRLRRTPLRFVLRRLVTWTPLRDPEEGYTVVLACMRELPALLAVNLRALGAMRLARMHELLLVFDCARDDLPEQAAEAIGELADSTPVRTLFYTSKQLAVANRINWGWVYSWLSWVIGLAASRTRHVLLHDLDAIPLDPDLFEEQFESALVSGAHFHGTSRYVGNGVTPELGLVRTFELFLDVAYVRESFKPLDVYNNVQLIEGRYVDLDTFLLIERSTRRRAIHPVEESQLFHPSQLICQYTDYAAGRSDLSNMQHNLLVMVYLLALEGEDAAMLAMTERLSDIGATSVSFLNRALPIAHLKPEHWAWHEKQIRQLEQHLFGATRSNVEAFLTGFIARAGSARTVGVEAVECGGVLAI